MSFKIGFSTSRRSILAHSILAISVIAALSSVAGVFAQTTTSNTTSTTSSSSQTGTGSQSGSSGSGVQYPHMGANAGNGTVAPGAATARYSA
jgi:hypothetical protein